MLPGAALAMIAGLAVCDSLGAMVTSTSVERPTPRADSSASKQWAYSAWLELWVFPGDEAVFNPTFYADYNTLHVEARYNYEDRNTPSLWVRRQFRFGSPVTFEVTPMAALVFGRTNGAASGLEMEIRYKRLDWYSESEHVFDFSAKQNDFLYVYSELGIRP